MEFTVHNTQYIVYVKPNSFYYVKGTTLDGLYRQFNKCITGQYMHVLRTIAPKKKKKKNRMTEQFDQL